MPPGTLPYVICALPRSGSSVLCDALAATGVAGRPKEYFLARAVRKRGEEWGLPRKASLADYLRAATDHTRTPNGVFGFKVMRSDLETLLGGLPPAPGTSPAARLEALLPGLRYLRMTRRDVVRQAVSHLRAMQTNHWSSRQQGLREARLEAHYDFAALHDLVRTVRQFEAAWDRFFQEAGVGPLLVPYEDFAADQEGVVRLILASLGIDAPNPVFTRPLALERQGDALNVQWAERYREEVRAHHGTA